MIQVNRIYLIFNRLVTKKFLVDTSDTESLIAHKQLQIYLYFFVPEIKNAGRVQSF